MDSRVRNIEKAFAAVINDKKLPKDRTSEEINSIKAHLQENLFSASLSHAPQTGQIIIIRQIFDGEQHDIAYRLEKIDTSITADYGYVYSLVPVTEEQLTLEQRQEYQGSCSMSHEACAHLLLIGRWNDTAVNNIESWIKEKMYPKLVITASDEWQPAVELLKEYCPYIDEKDFLPFNIRKPLFSYLASKLKQGLVDLKNDIKASLKRVVNFISSALRPPAAPQLSPTPPTIPLISSLPLSYPERVAPYSISIDRSKKEKKNRLHLSSKRPSLIINTFSASKLPRVPSRKVASRSSENSASPRKRNALFPLSPTLSPASSNRSLSSSTQYSVASLRKRSPLSRTSSLGYSPSSRVTPPSGKPNSF